MIEVHASGDEKIQLKVIPGRFATPQLHISDYLEMTTMKTRCAQASQDCKISFHEIRHFHTCGLDDLFWTALVGAFLAEELAKAGVLSMNAHKTI